MDSYLEYIAVTLGIAYVLLAARGMIWCWLLGIVSSALYIYININSKLYQDAILQFYYVIAGFYGWWLWARPSKKDTGFMAVSYSIKQNLQLILLGALLVPFFGFAFSKLGNSLAYFDAAVTVFSFIATWMTTKKIIQNWLYWIVIDMVAAVMYNIKGLHATAGLYIFFSIIAIYGYYEWRKQIRLI